MDIPSFLRAYPPFDDLDDQRLAEVIRHTHIEFHPEGEVILQQGGEPARYLYVVRTGAVELVDDGRVVDLLTEGQVFGHPSLLSGLSPTFTVRAHEDSLCYLVDRELAEEILGTHSGLAFLSSGLRRRVVRALEGLGPQAVDPWRAPVRTLVRRPPVMTSLTSTIREAAELMTRERVSSLLVARPDGLGILTDRDLRSRVMAEGRSTDTMVGEVLTSPVITVPAEMMVAEVISLMLERGVRHVPVTGDDGSPIGLVTDVDLMGLEQKAPFVLKADIERAPDVTTAVEAARRLPVVVCSLVDANVDPIDVGHVVAVAIDTLTRRLLEIGVSQLGEPPARWAWLSLGSEARQEQALLSDQDHAIAYQADERSVESVDPYFEGLAEFVTSGLEAAGIRRCRGGVMAVNRKWRRPLTDWILQFKTWMSTPGPLGSEIASIAFDYRQVAGPLDIEASIDQLIRGAAASPWFMQQLARRAIDPRPPTGFFRDLVVEAKGEWAGTLDVKGRGIIPITNLARTYAVGARLTENRTLRRLRAAAAGRIDQETCVGLTEAFRLLWQIRLEHQSELVRAGRPPDDHVDPKALGPLTRQGAKEAFRLIDRAQRALASELGMRML